MTTTPRVSVLLPVFNARPFLDDCLQSLVDQTYDDFEILAVDDGSKDGSREILESWAEADGRIRVVRQPHLGLVSTLNAGLEHCRGEIVARMDADDVADPRRLELQIEALEGPGELDVVSCLVEHFPEHDVAEGFRVYESWINSLVRHEQILCERFIESPIPHPTAVLRRATLAEVGGYQDRGWPEDYDLWLRMAHAGKRFGKVTERLYYWREHPTRLTRTDSRYAVEKFIACKARYLLDGPLRGIRRLVVWGAGQTGRRLSKHLLRGGAPIEGFIDIDPQKIGRTLRGRPIEGVEALESAFQYRRQTLLLVAVSSRGARRLIREQLAALGLQETRDFWLAA